MADDHDRVLRQKIDELESLISHRTASGNNATGAPAGDQPEVPILDDLVTSEDLFSQDDDDLRLVDIADRLEEKFTTELDEIVNLLKVNLKESILSELQDQASKGQHSRLNRK